MTKALAAVLFAVLLAGCTLAPASSATDFRAAADAPSSPTDALADRVLAVPDQYRPVRACLFAAIAIEVMVDRVRLFEPDRAEETLGRAQTLQGAVEAARTADPLWRNADMADVALVFGRVLLETTKERIAGYIGRGLSLDAILTGARRVAAQTLKGGAMLRDADAMVAGLADGAYGEAQIWASCEDRIAANRKMINDLTGTVSR